MLEEISSGLAVEVGVSQIGRDAEGEEDLRVLLLLLVAGEYPSCCCCCSVTVGVWCRATAQTEQQEGPTGRLRGREASGDAGAEEERRWWW